LKMIIPIVTNMMALPSEVENETRTRVGSGWDSDGVHSSEWALFNLLTT